MTVGRYAPGSAFESCPAATGETHDAGPGQTCGTYPDTAHRCRLWRDPHHDRHKCLCGHEWTCLDAGALDDPQIAALLHPPRHSA